MPSEKELYHQALENRLRREFIPPQHYRPLEDPHALPKEDTYEIRVIRAMCDVAMRKLRIYRTDPENREALLDLLSLLQALEECGYKAHGDLGKKLFLQATRIREVKNG